MNKGKWGKPIIGVVSVLIFIFLWDLFSLIVNSSYLPSPQQTFIALTSMLIHNERDFLGLSISQHISASLVRVFYGFVLAAVIAIPLGLLSGWLWYAEAAISPIMELIRPIPPLAWIPFAIYFFKDPIGSVFIVFVGAFFPIFLSTVAAVKSIDPLLIDAAKTLGAEGLNMFRKVVIPASIPGIITGLRTGVGIAWMCVIASELVGVKSGGLGLYIILMSEVGRFENVFAGMIIIGALGFIMVTSIAHIERRLSTWAGMS